jgi:hypothetical protein
MAPRAWGQGFFAYSRNYRVDVGSVDTKETSAKLPEFLSL